MKITESAGEEYTELIKSLYSGDLRLDSHINQTKHLLSQKNPFFKNAEAKNFSVLNNGKPIGHISAMIDKRNPRIGIIGFYDCINNNKASKLLFEQAFSFLSDCKIIKGPINQTIWNNYRFINSNTNPPTIFDPHNKDYYLDFWKQEGFQIAEEYVSAVRSDFNYVLPHTKDSHHSALNAGYTIRGIKDLDSDLKIIFSLSKEIFKQSWNYVDISYEEFIYNTHPVLSLLDTDFFEILETPDNKPVGFSFTLKNPYIKNQLILKTLGISPAYQGKKLAAALLYSQHIKAKKQGFKEFYYPLIRKGNNVTKFPYQGYEIITNYQVFESSPHL